MPLDRSRADEQPRTDLRIRQPITGKPPDLELLSGQLVASLNVRFRTVSPVAPSSRLARSAKAPMSISLSMPTATRSCARRRCGDPATKPLAVDQMGAGEIDAASGRAEECDRLAVQVLGLCPVAEQGTRPGLETESPVGAADRGAPVSRRKASPATSLAPARAPASMSSGRAQAGRATGSGSSRRSRPSRRASSYRPSPLFKTRLASRTTIAPRPRASNARCPSASLISRRASGSRPGTQPAVARRVGTARCESARRPHPARAGVDPLPPTRLDAHGCWRVAPRQEAAAQARPSHA